MKLVRLLAAAMSPCAAILAGSLASADDGAKNLAKYNTCPGGYWVAKEKLTDGDGNDFVPVRTCEWTLDGAAIAFKQEFLYADGVLRTESVGLNGWDASENTMRVFGAMSHGGMIYDATFIPETLREKEKIMEFKFVSGATGDVSEWRSVETHIDKDNYTEAGLMRVDGEWKQLSFLTFRRIETLDHEAVFNAGEKQ